MPVPTRGMIVLRNDPPRAMLRAFGLAVSIVGAMVVALTSWLSGTFNAWSAGVVLAYGVIGWCVPELSRLPYRLWNKAARVYARVTEVVLMHVAYWSVIVPVGWAGSALTTARRAHGDSLWVSRHPKDSMCPLRRAETSGHWVRRYAAPAWQAGERWRLALVPFMLILSSLNSEEIPALSDDLYTLY